MASYDYFYGIRGVRFIYHGEWADPELSYYGKVVNYNAVENHFWSLFHEEHPDNDGDNDKDDEEFAAWMKAHGRDVKDFIMEC